VLSVTRGPFGPLVDIRFFAVTHTFVGGGHLPQSELRNQFDQRDVTVVRADGPDLRLPRRPFKVVSNPRSGSPRGSSSAWSAPVVAWSERTSHAVACRAALELAKRSRPRTLGQ